MVIDKAYPLCSVLILTLTLAGCVVEVEQLPLITQSDVLKQAVFRDGVYEMTDPAREDATPAAFVVKVIEPGVYQFASKDEKGEITSYGNMYVLRTTSSTKVGVVDYYQPRGIDNGSSVYLFLVDIDGDAITLSDPWPRTDGLFTAWTSTYGLEASISKGIFSGVTLRPTDRAYDAQRTTAYTLRRLFSDRFVAAFVRPRVSMKLSPTPSKESWDEFTNGLELDLGYGVSDQLRFIDDFSALSDFVGEEAN